MTYSETITGGVPVEVYGGLAAADAYVTAKIGAGAKRYRRLIAAKNGDERKRLLIEATRYLERLSWQGTRNGAGGTTLAWPRSGVTVDNVAVDPTTVPPAIVQAAFELVAVFAVDEDAAAAADQGSNVRVLDADGTRIEFFRSTSARDGSAGVLPVVVQQLIRKYLSGGGATVVVSGGSSGTGSDSAFDDCDVLKRWDPF
ncbi:MAG: putative DnaT-like ssDNA binding protein [Acidimicrobiaceae bacterium]|jgi:hypothetical protein|nr:putative DnaT-like ssDNA binding protein [Acidimicrobiaceae bacterium]